MKLHHIDMFIIFFRRVLSQSGFSLAAVNDFTRVFTHQTAALSAKGEANYTFTVKMVTYSGIFSSARKPKPLRLVTTTATFAK